jgi:UTP-glucose-1-phosphate uridylyltransferase
MELKKIQKTFLKIRQLKEILTQIKQRKLLDEIDSNIENICCSLIRQQNQCPSNDNWCGCGLSCKMRIKK